MARQMRALVEQLLTLARSDSGSQRPALTPLDLSQLIQTRILPFEALFYERGLRLRDEITDGLRVSGDAQTLGQVVDILLDNAQKYATGGEVIGPPPAPEPRRLPFDRDERGPAPCPRRSLQTFSSAFTGPTRPAAPAAASAWAWPSPARLSKRTTAASGLRATAARSRFPSSCGNCRKRTPDLPLRSAARAVVYYNRIEYRRVRAGFFMILAQRSKEL